MPFTAVAVLTGAGCCCSATRDQRAQHVTASRAGELGLHMVRLPIQEHLPELHKAVMNVNVVFDMLMMRQVRQWDASTVGTRGVRAVLFSAPITLRPCRLSRTGSKSWTAACPHGCTATAARPSSASA